MKDLFQKLADNLKAAKSPEGWIEDETDRKVTVTEDKLLIRGTFEHAYDRRGGRHRVSLKFWIENGKLVNDNEDECPLDGDVQAFVNSCFTFSCG